MMMMVKFKFKFDLSSLGQAGSTRCGHVAYLVVREISPFSCMAFMTVNLGLVKR